ncbi:hypothetical protein Pelo_378 [Pelomyxa schiedti]|nr:hypothetical protein Pelo_378 [Pelomyxa schiedti]
MVAGNEASLGHAFMVRGQGGEWELMWRGSSNAFSASSFHHRCNGWGSTATIVRTPQNYVFGGFTPIPWESTGGVFYDIGRGCGGRTFVYSLLRAGTPSGTLLRCKNHNICTQNHSSCTNLCGPAFCSGPALFITDYSNFRTGSKTDMGDGRDNDLPPQQPYNEWLAGSYDKWTTEEVEVWRLAIAQY